MQAQAKVLGAERSDLPGGRANAGAVAQSEHCSADMASHVKWVVGFEQPSPSRKDEGQWISVEATGQGSWDLLRHMGDGTSGMIGDPKQRRSRDRRALGTSHEARLGVIVRLADQVVVAVMPRDSTTLAERRTCGVAACWQRRGASRNALGLTGANARVAGPGTQGASNQSDGPTGKGAPDRNVRSRYLEAVLGKTRRTEFQRGTRKRSHGRGYTGTKLETADTAKPLPTDHCAMRLLTKSARTV
jgi:hypothetical protein